METCTETAPDAFDGLDAETVDAITGTVTPEAIMDFVGVLTPTPQSADAVRRALQTYTWFPTLARLDTQRRRMRTIRDAAVLAGHPVCTTNAGYFLGTAAHVQASAERARRFAAGATARAERLTRLAQQMTHTDEGH
jgi:hypothetical protein